MHVMAALAAMLITVLARSASAATLTVNTTAVPAPSGKCGIVEAVEAMRVGAGTAACVPTGGTAWGTDDTVVLIAGTYRLQKTLRLATEMTLKGPAGGYDSVKIDGSQIFNGYDEIISMDDSEYGFGNMGVYIKNLTVQSSPERQYTTGIMATSSCDAGPNSSCVYLNLDTVRVTGCTNSGIKMYAGTEGAFNGLRIDHNTASLGGGIFTSALSAFQAIRMQNSTIEDNTAGSGAGLYYTGLLRLSNVTIRNNIASSWGGGIFWNTCHSDPDSDLYFEMDGTNHVTNNYAGFLGGGGFFNQSRKWAFFSAPEFSGNTPATQTFTTDTCYNMGDEPPGGFRGEYYNLPSGTPIPPAIPLGTPTTVRADKTINFTTFPNPPAPGVSTDKFFVRWTGRLKINTTSNYTFYITSDNGRRLWINGQLVIDKWLDDWSVEYASAPITLTAGQSYDIRLEYFENSGGENITLKWSSTSNPSKVIVPESSVYWPFGSAQPFLTKLEAESAPQADRPNVGTENCSENGQNLMDVGNNEYAVYRNLNLAGILTYNFRTANAGFATSIEVRRDSTSGTLLATCSAPVTGGWQNWQTVTCPATATTTGTGNLYLVFKGSSANSQLTNLNWLRLVR